MRALLSLVAGGPGRVATLAAAVVVIAFVLAGAGEELARVAWFAFLCAVTFVLLFVLLAIAAAAVGVPGESPVTVKEADR